MSLEKPLTEKSPTLFIPKDAFGETKPKNKYCTRSVLSKILAILLFALLVTLVVEFLFPVIERRYHANVIDVIEVYDEGPIDVKVPPDVVVDFKSNVSKEPWHLDFLINPTRLCDTLEPPETQAYARDPEVKLLMLVPSATDHFAQRDAIRKTWGSLATKSHGPMRLGFVLGSTANASETSRIAEESERYGDVIQADFPDTDRTAKSVLMLKWVSSHCSHAEYFLKASDDTFVNLDVLQAVTRKDPFAPGGRFIGGFIHRGAQPSRNMGENYFVSESDFPSSVFPPYVSGSSYLTTGPTASRLFEASKGVKPLLPMDDVYVTGLCAEEIAANLVHEPCFRDEDISLHSSWDTLSSLATVHSVSPEDMDKLWNDMTKAIYDAIHFPDEGFLGEPPESTLEQIKPLFDLGSLFDWADGSLEDSSSEQSVDFNQRDPIAEMIDDFFDISEDQSDSTDSSSLIQGPTDGLLDLNSLIRNLLVNNKFSFDRSGDKNTDPLGFGSIPNQHIIIGSIRSRVLLPNFEDKNNDAADLGLSPFQRIMMNLGRSGFMSPVLNNGAVDSRSSQSQQSMNSHSSFLSPSLEYNRDPLNIGRNLNMLSQSSSYIPPSFETNNNINSRQRANQNIMSNNIQSSFGAHNSEYSMDSQGTHQQQNLPDWPGSQKTSDQQQSTRFNLPLRWQKTFIIPLPLDQAGGRGMNLTEYLPH